VLACWLEEKQDRTLSPADNEELGGDGMHEPISKLQEDSVFLQSYIPRTLNEVYDPERDVAAVRRGEGKELIYANTIGIVDIKADGDVIEDQAKEEPENGHSQGSSDAEGESSSSESDDSGSGNEGGFVQRQARGHRHEDREAKKERKKAAKAEAREKRQHKMPKADKKRRIRATSSKK